MCRVTSHVSNHMVSTQNHCRLLRGDLDDKFLSDDCLDARIRDDSLSYGIKRKALCMMKFVKKVDAK